MIKTITDKTIQKISVEYQKDNLNWLLGFSGGKDSTAVLKLCYQAMQNIGRKTKSVTIVYCDTGVEIPIIDTYVKTFLRKLKKESQNNDIPISIKIVTPNIEDRFFSKVLGRGYPPPTNKFRWCTNRLRINPIRKIYTNIKEPTVLLLGVRKGESNERDKTIKKHLEDDIGHLRQSGNNKIKIYSPIIDYSTIDVWNTLDYLEKPICHDLIKLKMLYNLNPNISEIENNILNNDNRFGCWTCTVVRKDKAVQNLINQGFNELQPLFDFRNWLMLIRDDEKYRCKYRRNGNIGFGPFTLDARKEILKRLLKTQEKSGINLISEQEIEYIKKQWVIDKKSKIYKEK